MSSDDEDIVCYAPTMVTSTGIWQGDSPLAYALPLFILQLILIMVATRTVAFILKPLRQPRVISEILGGLALGPSGFGRYRSFSDFIFPLRSVAVLETMANLGLLYFLFLVGVEMDLSIVRRSGRKALAIAVAGMLLPFLIGAVTTIFFEEYLAKDGVSQSSFLLFLGVALSITAFPCSPASSPSSSSSTPSWGRSPCPRPSSTTYSPGSCWPWPSPSRRARPTPSPPSGSCSPAPPTSVSAPWWSGR